MSAYLSLAAVFIHTILFASRPMALSPLDCRNLVCHGVGDCINNQTACACDTQGYNATVQQVVYYMYDAGTNCSSCTWNYFGVNCTQWGLECRESRCHSNGTCTGRWDGCACDNFQDPAANCSTCLPYWSPDTRCATCVLGHYGYDCQQTSDECREQRCNGHGDCTGQTNGCLCDEGWSGDTCAVEHQPDQYSGAQITGLTMIPVVLIALVPLANWGWSQYIDRSTRRKKLQ
jgi:hypothetical protein